MTPLYEILGFVVFWTVALTATCFVFAWVVDRIFPPRKEEPHEIYRRLP